MITIKTQKYFEMKYRKIFEADGKVDSIKLKAMVKHWSQQMSAAGNRDASRNATQKASQFCKRDLLAKKIEKLHLRLSGI